MTPTEHALPAGEIPSRAARLCPPRLALAAVGLVMAVVTPAVIAAPDADLPATSARGARPAASPPPGSSPSPTRDARLLVADGERIHDIDKIIEALDRRAPVSAVAFSPDGALIASGSEDHRVRVWQVATGRLLRRLEGHSSAVTAVAFSPDGNALASASNDRTVRLWDAHSGRLLRTLQGHVYHVYAVAFDAQGRWLATASWDRTIQLWDARRGVVVRKLRGHGAPIRAIDFSRDGKRLASGADDHTVRLWSVDTGAQLRSLAGHTGPVTAVRFRPDGKWLFSGSADQTVRMWRLPDGATVRKFADCGAPVHALAISANGHILAGACGASGAVLWDIPTQARLRRLGGHAPADARAVAFSPDGRMVAIGSEDASIVVEDLAAGRTVVALSANVAHLDAVAVSPDAGMLAAASRDQRVLIWQQTGEHRSLRRVLVGGSVRTLAFSPDGKTLATGERDRQVVVWDLRADGPPRKLGGHEGAVNAVAFTPDGRSLLSAADDATLRRWNLKQGTEARVMKGHASAVRALAVSPDGTVVASASDDATVRLWDLATGRSPAVLQSHRGPVTSVVFTADGKYLVTGSLDRTIDVWLLARRKLLKTMRKELPAGVVALAALGHRIVAASSDGMLSLWELAANRPLKQSTDYADAVSALAAASDPPAIASASRDGVLRLWDSETLERRWSLAGSTRERWFACNDAKTCWRWEDGALLGRVDRQGDIVPASPSDDAHRTTLAAVIDRKRLPSGAKVREGGTASIPVHIENRGVHPAYWVRVSQSVQRTAVSKTSLVLIPPPTIPVLAAGNHADVVCEVSALGEYENPQPHSDTLRLTIASASADALSLAIPVAVDTPNLKLRGLVLRRDPALAVVASLTEVAMAQLEPVRVEGNLTLEGDSPASMAPIVLEQVLRGQDLALSFPLPEGVRLDRSSRATFAVHKVTHPAHVWTFAHAPISIPIPVWSWAVLLGALLGLGFVIWRADLLVRARPLGRAGKRLARLAVAAMLVSGRALRALFCIRSTVRSVRARLERRSIAIIFFRLQPETQCSHLARQLGAAWAPLSSGRDPVFELHFGRELPLNVERCLLALPPDGDALAAALAHLEATPEPQATITVVLSDVPWSELAEHLHGPRQLVVLTKAAMNRVLRAPRPALAFAQAVSDQVDRTAVSLYRSAVAGGQRQPFHGRKSELRRLAVDPRRNCLIVGPHGIGKTSLLDEIHRRFQSHPTVECHYLSLADGDLTTALADALGMPDERSLPTLLERLGDRPQGKKVVVLCDDADAWATLDAASGGRQLAALARLNQGQRCSFVLAGFLGLLHAARPLPGREPFGDLVRLECLDTESCDELATTSMAALNLHYASTDLVELIAHQSGGLPSLLVTLCDQVVAGLEPDQHTISRAVVERACKSEAVVRAITAWRPRFGLKEPRLATLDQTVMLAAVFKTRFTLHELASTLENLDVQATAAEVEHSARRLVAACVFEQWLGHYHFRVPLFQTVMQEATLARMVAQG